MQHTEGSAGQFDLIGNHSIPWKSSACDLLVAVKALSEAETKQKNEAEADNTKVPFLRSFWPRIMLRAFAFECLATAIKAKCGKVIYSSGHLRKSKDHRLVVMLSAAGVSLTSNDKNLLDRMTAVAIAYGRFPLPTHPNRFKDFQPGKSGDFRIEWMPNDEIRYLQLLDQLMNSCEFTDEEKKFFRA